MSALRSSVSVGRAPNRMVRRVHLLVRGWQAQQRKWGVPLYIGEFSTVEEKQGSIPALAEYFVAFNRYGWSWTPWTYKQVGGPTPKAGGRQLDGRTWDEYPAAGQRARAATA